MKIKRMLEIEVTPAELAELYLKMTIPQKAEFLRSAGFSTPKPKKLTAKQREAQELELFLANRRRKDQLAADRMTEELKRSLR